ncbi:MULTISPECIES: polysaccharide deacetylase family protein [Paenibacillus]|uniref:polysaccharide deacetylase family protein n=2 Tax=Paenibacillus TaxID=44249 RepID=UPI001B37BCBC|nr:MULTISPECIES: polysaccharide deacetylase family protein [Paenibacillus]MBQ4898508.1 polysaccharide deacetylase family protein [Paenibacillus sp. Marseille-P2973]
MIKLISKKVLLFAAVCLLLSACGQKQETPEPTPSATESNAAAPSGGTSATSTDSETGQNQENGTDPAGPNDQNNNDKQNGQEQPVNLYYIDHTNNVVPLEEGAEKKVVLLTFDDGPKEKEMIDDLIDTLDKHNAKAIFFVNGYRVKEKPELLKLIHDRGQIIGNHSWDHIDLNIETEDSVRKQIEDVQNIVEDTIGEKPRFFRPPFGSVNDTLQQIVGENDMIYTTWSNDSLDWDPKNNKPEAVIQNIMDQMHPGSNILMHELPWTVEGLDELLTKLEAEGYSFVDPRTISDNPGTGN